MKKNLLRSFWVALCASLAAFSQAAHWVLVSQADSTTVSSYASSGATRGARATVSVAIPSGSYAIYGSGTYTYFGEPDTFADDLVTMSSSFLYTFDPYVNAYYTYVYKWVSDAPTDVPPGVGSTPDLDGYGLQRATVLETVPQGMSGSSGTYSAAALFNTQGPTWSGGGSPYTGFANLWPLPTASPIVTIGTKLYYVRPVVVGGGTVSLDGSGNTIVTSTVLNSQLVEYSVNITYQPNMYMELKSTSQTTCYLGVAEIGGLPVH